VPTTSSADLHVVGSASIWVLGQVAGARRTATVLHAGNDAVYLDLQGACLAVLAARAVQVPCGVRTMLPALLPAAAGTEVAVRDGAIELPGCEVLVTNIVDTTVPVLTADAARWGRDHLAAVAGGQLDRARAELPPDALTRLGTADAAAVNRLLGLGPGLTPLGDDVLAGWLATAVACRNENLAEVRRAVALSAPERTTLLSATLLGCAARGEAVPELRAMLSGIATQNTAVVQQSVELLARVGDTSGQGLILGALLALEASAPSGATA
jgi:hypothetical protein